MKTLKYLFIAIALISSTIKAYSQDTIYINWNDLEKHGLTSLDQLKIDSIQFDGYEIASLDQIQKTFGQMDLSQYNQLASQLQTYYIASKFPPTFEAISNFKGVTSVYISKAMLKTFGSSMIGDPKISAIAGNLNSIEIINCENKKYFYTISNYISKVVESYNLETLARINDDGEKVSIFSHSTNEKIDYLLMLVDDNEDMTVISMSGDIPLDKVGELVNSKK